MYYSYFNRFVFLNKYWFLIVIITIGFSSYCQKHEPILLLNDAKLTYNIWDNAATSYYIDTLAHLNFESIKKQKFSSSLGVSDTFVFTNASIWVKISVKRLANSKHNWIIGTAYNLVDSLDFFVIDSQSKLINHQISGRLISARKNEISSHSKVFPLYLRENENHTLYFRFAGKENKKVYIQINESNQFYNESQKETWFWAAYIGFYLTMMLVQIIFLSVTKRSISLYYLLYLFAFLMVEISRGNGMIGERFLWPEQNWFKANALLIFVPISTILGMLFYANGLLLKKHSKVLYQILLFDASFALIFGIYSLFFDKNINVTLNVLIMALFSDLLVLLACWVVWRKGYKVAVFYLIGTICFFIGIIFTLFWHLGLVPNILLMHSAINFGCIFEMTFFTIAIAYEYRLNQQDKLSAQKNLVGILKIKNAEISEALLKGQTTERQRVAIDLHDNLGSTISSIKYSLEAIDRSKMNADEVAVQENLYSLLDKAYNDVRLLSHNLLPEEFEKKGLTETLTEFVRKINKASKIKFDLKVDENFGRHNHKIEFELYSICMELVNNIMKHSKATEAKITLSKLTPPSGRPDVLDGGLAPQPPKEEQIRLTVSDNGIGIFKNDSDGKGMKNIQARVDSINGKWTVKSVEGEGVLNEIVVNG